MDRALLKSNARAALGNGIFQTNWLVALAICIVETVLVSAVSATGVGALILTGPLFYGITKVFYRQSRQGGDFAFADLFDGFNYFIDTMLIGLVTTIFTFLWSLLFIVPGIIKGYAYSMAYYIKIDHPEYDWRMCIEESKKLTKGHIGELFVLDLSFLGWLFVGALAFGIGTLWVSPYMYATKSQAYLWLVAQQERNNGGVAGGMQF